MTRKPSAATLEAKPAYNRTCAHLLDEIKTRLGVDPLEAP